MQTIAQTLNEKSTKYSYELNEVIKYVKGSKSIVLNIVKAHKKGTKRVFFAAATDNGLITSTLYGRKNEAVSLAKKYSQIVLNK